ncbi:MAG: hypothetical protein Q9167_006088 [Letrouitia subvulpina]
MLEKFEIFRTWFLQNIMDIENKNTIIVLPIEKDLKPIYRDDPPAIPSVPAAGLGSLHLSPLLGAPELVVPIGTIPYKSRVTEKTEQLPIAVALLGAPGTDLKLVETALECLQRSGRPTRVLTGKKLF